MPASDLSPAYFNHLKVSDMFQLDDISLNRTVHVPSPAKQLQPQEIIGIEFDLEQVLVLDEMFILLQEL